MLYIQAWQERFDRLLIIRIPIAMASLHQLNSNLYQFIISTIPDINFKPFLSNAFLILSIWLLPSGLLNLPMHMINHIYEISQLWCFYFLSNKSKIDLDLHYVCSIIYLTYSWDTHVLLRMGRSMDAVFLLADLVILIGIL